MKKNLCLILLCFLSSLCLWFAQIRREQMALAENIAPQILRFHVIANSNSSEDQEIKLKVKSYLLERIYQQMEQCNDAAGCTDSQSFVEGMLDEESLTKKVFTGDGLNERYFNPCGLNGDGLNKSGLNKSGLNKSVLNKGVLNEGVLNEGVLNEGALAGKTATEEVFTREAVKMFLITHREELERDAESYIRALGKSYPVSLNLTWCEFPEKTYGNLRLPAGNYEAAQVKIGAARGHNWWCVLYPKICITKDAVATVPDSSLIELQRLLSPEDFQKLLLQRPAFMPKVRFSFFALEKRNADKQIPVPLTQESVMQDSSPAVP